MAITHDKVSGLTNPSNPDLIGGEDWDAAHVVLGPVLVGMSQMRITTGGAITSQTTAGFSGSFSKTATGTYRADFDTADYNGGSPIIVACVSVDSGGAQFLRWTIENDGDDYVQLVTMSSEGDAVNIDAGYISLTASTILT